MWNGYFHTRFLVVCCCSLKSNSSGSGGIRFIGTPFPLTLQKRADGKTELKLRPLHQSKDTSRIISSNVISRNIIVLAPLLRHPLLLIALERRSAIKCRVPAKWNYGSLFIGNWVNGNGGEEDDEIFGLAIKNSIEFNGIFLIIVNGSDWRLNHRRKARPKLWRRKLIKMSHWKNVLVST